MCAYRIHNTVNGKGYAGRTTRTLARRCQARMSRGRRGRGCAARPRSASPSRRAGGSAAGGGSAGVRRAGVRAARSGRVPTVVLAVAPREPAASSRGWSPTAGHRPARHNARRGNTRQSCILARLRRPLAEGRTAPRARAVPRTARPPRRRAPPTGGRGHREGARGRGEAGAPREEHDGGHHYRGGGADLRRRLAADPLHDQRVRCDGHEWTFHAVYRGGIASRPLTGVALRRQVESGLVATLDFDGTLWGRRCLAGAIVALTDGRRPTRAIVWGDGTVTAFDQREELMPEFHGHVDDVGARLADQLAAGHWLRYSWGPPAAVALAP